MRSWLFEVPFLGPSMRRQLRVTHFWGFFVKRSFFQTTIGRMILGARINSTFALPYGTSASWRWYSSSFSTFDRSILDTFVNCFWKFQDVSSHIDCEIEKFEDVSSHIDFRNMEFQDVSSHINFSNMTLRTAPSKISILRGAQLDSEKKSRKVVTLQSDIDVLPT